MSRVAADAGSEDFHYPFTTGARISAFVPATQPCFQRRLVRHQRWPYRFNIEVTVSSSSAVANFREMTTTIRFVIGLRGQIALSPAEPVRSARRSERAFYRS